MRGDTVKILKRQVANLEIQVADLERAMKTIVAARQRGYGIHYCEGVAEAALEILEEARERAS